MTSDAANLTTGGASTARLARWLDGNRHEVGGLGASAVLAPEA
jgi:hypothetical protein